MNIAKDIRYIGVNDHEIDLFEGQYIVPDGTTYSSYAIIDEKIAVMDTVTIRTVLNAESKKKLEALANELMK